MLDRPRCDEYDPACEDESKPGGKKDFEVKEDSV
jgi:hypothetical protein